APRQRPLDRQEEHPAGRRQPCSMARPKPAWGASGAATLSTQGGSMQMRVGRRNVLLSAVVAALAVSAVVAPSASAVLKRLANGHIVSYQPLRNAKLSAKSSAPKIFDETFNNMDYNGGPLMPSNTDYM